MFLEYLSEPIRQTLNFNGRSTRKQYWMFQLWQLIIGLIVQFGSYAAGWVERPFQQSSATMILQYLFFLPGLALAVRRLHDQDRSGWWVLVPFLNIILVGFVGGTPGLNRYDGASFQAAPQEIQLKGDVRSENGQRHVFISWQEGSIPSSGVEYCVFRQLQPSGAVQEIARVARSKYRDHAVAEGQAYTYWVIRKWQTQKSNEVTVLV